MGCAGRLNLLAEMKATERTTVAAFAALGLAVLCGWQTLRAAAATAQAALVVCEGGWHDQARDRTVPVRIRLPAGSGRVPVILFSHGLGGSLDAGTTWGEAWSRSGFAVIQLQHPGSDQDLWRGERPLARLSALRRGMTADQLIARVGDVAFVLDELARRRSEGRCDLTRLDLTRVGMSGHSFGAHTTQAVAGQRFGSGGGTRALRDRRIKAAVAFSPAPPQADDAVVRAAFAAIDIPFMSVTGTRDEVPVLNDVSPADRTLPFRYMPAGRKYLLVMDGATHADFGGNPAGGLRGGNRHVDDVVIAATTAFWRAALLDDSTERDWLEDGGLQARLARGDAFQFK